MDLLIVNKAWDFLSNEALAMEKDGGSSVSSQEEKLTNDRIRQSIDILDVNNYLKVFGEYYLEKYRIYLIHDAVPAFWANFTASDASVKVSSGSVLRMVNAVDQLHDENRRWINNPVINAFLDYCSDTNEKRRELTTQLKAVLFAEIPMTFHDHLVSTYSYCFKISRCRRRITSIDEFHASMSSTSSQDYDDHEDADELLDITSNANESECMVCGKQMTGVIEFNSMEDEDMMTTINEPSNSSSNVSSVCNCSEILEVFDKMNIQLKSMNILSDVAEDAVTSVIHTSLEKYIRIKTRNSYDSHILARVLKWIKKVVLRWLLLIYGGEYYDQEKLAATSDRLKYLAYEIYAKIRIEQLFDIIIDFPDSSPAIEDVKSCLEYCYGYRSGVIQSLKKSFENRLLHPGVATNDILITYIQTIRSLRMLDPSGVILQLVCDPIKCYLKSKDDTVKCIIAALTDENSDLISELVKSGQTAADGENRELSPSDDESIVKTWQTWKPDPIDALKAPKNCKFIRSSDIVSILVNVYESKDLFVEEYQRLLAKRFLSTFDCNVDFERRNLELLTLKFGESDLNTCEVMMKDMTDSRKIDSRVNSADHEIAELKLVHGFPLNCLILSAQFWPEKFNLNNYDEGSGVELPPVVTDSIEKYTKSFEVFKTARTLEWKKNIGVVDVELNFDDGTIYNFKVPPIQATVIYHFQNQSSWNVADLSHAMSVPSSVIRKRILFWINKCIIRQVSHDTYELIEDQSNNVNSLKSDGESRVNSQDDDGPMDEDEMSASDVTGDESSISRTGMDVEGKNEDDKFRIIWAYIESMLTNLSEMTLERIHSTLSMFALSNPATGQLTLQELSTFLDGKIREGRLTFTSGLYKLSSA